MHFYNLRTLVLKSFLFMITTLGPIVEQIFIMCVENHRILVVWRRLLPLMNSFKNIPIIMFFSMQAMLL